MVVKGDKLKTFYFIFFVGTLFCLLHVKIAAQLLLPHCLCTVSVPVALRLLRSLLFTISSRVMQEHWRSACGQARASLFPQQKELAGSG